MGRHGGREDGALEEILDAIANATDPVALVEAGRVRWANAAFAALVGRDVESLVGTASGEVMVLDTPAAGDGTVLGRAIADAGETQIEVRIVDCGRSRQMLVVQPLPSRPRAISGWAGDEIYRALFEVNAAIKLLICPTTGLIVDANQAAAEFYGWPLEVLRTMRITDINTLSPEEVAAEMENARTMRRRYFRFRHRTARGDERHVEVHSGPVRIAGEQLLFSIIHDVTERDQLEEQLLRSQRLESIGRLAGGVAHDFNNLLTIILSSAGALGRRLDSESPLQRYVEDLGYAARRAAELTGSLLAFGRSQPLRARRLDVNDLCQGVGRLLSDSFGPSVNLTLALAEGLLPVEADPTQLEQAILNLALNARDAMPEGGELDIRTSLEALDATTDGVPPGAWVCVSVRDTGTGMNEETRRRAFEPFFTTKPAGTGTGLGLARVYGTVTQSRGHLTVDSEPGRGTRIAIYLPATDAPADRAPPVRRARVQRSTTGTGVLLVEDVSGLRGVLAGALQEAGFVVTQASSAEDALARWPAVRDTVSVVVSDVVMPGASGVELVEQLLAERPKLRVVLMSGYMREHDRTRLPGDVRFLAKPFSADELVLTVSAAVAADAD